MNCFDDYVKLINKLKKEEGEECLICHLPISNKNEMTTLRCNHHYHNECIKSNKIKTGPYTIITCSYCEKVSRFYEKKEVNKKSDVICKVILTTGKNAGNPCNRLNCKYHNKKVNKPVLLDNICSAIIKTGKNKGKQCNRKNCKIHKSNPIQNSDIIV